MSQHTIKSSLTITVALGLSLLMMTACTNPLAVTLTQVPNAPINLHPIAVNDLIELQEKPSPLSYKKVAKASIRLFNGQESQAMAAVKKRLGNGGSTHIYFGPNPVEAMNGQDTFYLPLGDSSFSMNANTSSRRLIGYGYVRK